jgi:hypothetical protein
VFYLASIISIIGLILSVAAVILIVGEVRQGKDLNLKEIGKQALSSFWPLLGGSLLLGLVLLIIMIPLIWYISFIGIDLVNIPMIMSGNIIGGIGTIGSVLATSVYIGIIVFLTVRFGFYFPAIVFGESAPALDKSWDLTKNHVCRLIGLYLVISLILFMIFEVPVSFLFRIIDAKILTTLIQTFLSLLTYIFVSATMAVVYFDLKVRQEAGDLLDLVALHDDVEKDNQTDSGGDVPADKRES